MELPGFWPVSVIKPTIRYCEFENDENYWILTIRGNKDKINPFLRFLCKFNPDLNHSPRDLHRAQLKLASAIVNAAKLDGSVVLENETIKKEENSGLDCSF